MGMYVCICGRTVMVRNPSAPRALKGGGDSEIAIGGGTWGFGLEGSTVQFFLLFRWLFIYLPWRTLSLVVSSIATLAYKSTNNEALSAG